MSCDLSLNGQYELSTVTHDNASGRYVVQLTKPPLKCAEGTFISRNPEVIVDSNLLTSVLRYDEVAHRPVILVPNQSYVQESNLRASSGIGFFAVFFILVLAGALYAIYRLLNRKWEEEQEEEELEEVATHTHSTPAHTYNSQRDSGVHSNYRTESPVSHPAPVTRPVASQSPATTVVVDHHGSSSGDLLTGAVLGSMMNNNRTEVIHEETVVERDREYNRDESRASQPSTFSSDEDSATVSSEDSSSTFSSDGDSDSSSFSSDDSSSSFSSDDSGSSFSSDDSSSSFSSDS